MAPKLPQYESYEKFWPFYLREHKKPATRAFHYVATVSASACVGLAVAESWKYLLLAPLAGYSFAWFSHFFIEKNKPATFKAPLWSLISDYRMFFHFITFSLDAQLEAAGVIPAKKTQAQ